MQNILKFIRKADEDYKMIEDNDTVLVGVSGGKDSMLLLYALSLYQKFDHKHFHLIACHLKMGFNNNSTDVIKQFCENHHITYYEEETNIAYILDHYKKKDGSIDCSRCSKLKRGAIVNAAKKYNANKIAFAHHRDDAVETFFLNAIYSGVAKSFKPIMEYEDNKVTFIRPLIYASEKDVIKACTTNQIPVMKSGCSKDGNSKRQEMKQLVQELYKKYPSSKKNLLSMLSNEENEVWKKVKE